MFIKGKRYSQLGLYRPLICSAVYEESLEPFVQSWQKVIKDLTSEGSHEGDNRQEKKILLRPGRLSKYAWKIVN